MPHSPTGSGDRRVHVDKVVAEAQENLGNHPGFWKLHEQLEAGCGIWVQTSESGLGKSFQHLFYFASCCLLYRIIPFEVIGYKIN